MAREATSVLLRRLGVCADLLRGGEARHRALARLSAARNRWRWRRLVRSVHRRQPGRPVVAISLVEHAGDLVAAEPVVRWLRHEQPNAFIAWIARQPYRALVQHHPDVDVVLTVNCLGEWIHLSRDAIFDRVIDLHVPGRDCRACGLWRSTAGAAVTIENYYDRGPLLHAFCRSAGIEPLDDAPQLHVPPAVRRGIDRLGLPDRYVVIHGSSTEIERDWLAEKWASLAERARRELGLGVVEVGLSPVIAAPREGYVNLCGKLSLLETAAVIARAEAFVGIDSGPAHFANAAGTAGVILLGRYRQFRRYLPYTGGYADGSTAQIIHADGPAATIDVEEAFAALQRVLARRRAPDPAVTALAQEQ